MMLLKFPATTAKLLGTGEQSKLQTGLPQQPNQLSTCFCKSLKILLSAPVGAGSTLQQGAEGKEAGQSSEFLHQSLGAAGQRGRPYGLTTASQGEAGLGADGTCSAGERAFLLFMLSGGNASQAFRMAL